MYFHIIFHYNCIGCLIHQAKKAEIHLRERGKEKEKQVCPHRLLRKLPVFSLHACTLSRSSPVRLFATSWTVACRLLCPWGFSGQEYWGGLPRLPPGDLPNLGIEPRWADLWWAVSLQV